MKDVKKFLRRKFSENDICTMVSAVGLIVFNIKDAAQLED